MTKLDMTDEEVAKAVLKRLADRGLKSLRPMEEQAPVSRGTLARWQDGKYAMQPKVRAKAEAWLGLTDRPLSASYAEGVEDATRRFREEIWATIERVAREMGEVATSARTEETLHDESTAYPGEGNEGLRRDPK